MRVGVIPHVLPLLFAYDATAEADDGQQDGSTAVAEAAATAGEGATAAAEERGPKFLGLGIVRSNMQVRHPCGTDCMSAIPSHTRCRVGLAAQSWGSACRLDAVVLQPP
jgi:hypothetical protein